MASPLAPTTDPIFPSLDAAREAYQRGDLLVCPEFTSSLKRLRWSLDGPLTTAISVMADPNDEPYYQPSSSLAAPSPADGTSSTSGTWHPISREPLTRPKLSSLHIRFDELSRWEEHWAEAHEGHWCPEYDASLGRDQEPDPTRTRIGLLPGEDPDMDPEDCEYDEDHEAGHLLMCCGEERPMDTEGDPRFRLVIRPKEEGGGGFLTVHDYVEQTHSWLTGLREEIKKAMVVSEAVRGRPPLPEGARLMVYASGEYLDVRL